MKSFFFFRLQTDTWIDFLVRIWLHLPIRNGIAYGNGSYSLSIVFDALMGDLLIIQMYDENFMKIASNHFIS